MKTLKKIRFPSGLLLMGVPVLVAVIMRLYRITETIRFRGDQGMDLMVIWHMEHAGHWPLVGPFLSLRDFYTPPTYYYVTWLFYHITQSVNGIVIGYFFMNIISLMLLMKLAWHMGGKQLASIVGGLFAISIIMIDHGRQFWQPYPMQLFITISLLFLWRAYQRKSLSSLWLFALHYMLALSVYPSPVLLLPYAGYQVVRWYKNIGKLPIWQSLLFSGFTMAVTFVIIYMPQIIFEISRGWPSLTFTGSVSAHFNLHAIITQISENIFYIFSSYLATHIFFPKEGFYITAFVIILFTAMAKWGKLPHTIRAFLAPEILAAGLVFLLLYQQDVHDHRMWAYLPFLFLITGISIHQGLNAKGVHKALAITILLIYSILNLSGFSLYTTRHLVDETREAVSIARYIKHSMSARGLTQYDTGFFLKNVSNPDSHSYGIYKILFWLIEDRTLTIPLKSKGNEPAFDYTAPLFKEYVFMVCHQFTSVQDAETRCIKPVIGSLPYTTLETEKIGRAYVFTLYNNTFSLSVPQRAQL
ncbi:hypothetical protein KJZ67_03200 [Patescibacteria group bacterium]|nr:hypothetical protein [Patescibacteria group bacterium]